MLQTSPKIKENVGRSINIELQRKKKIWEERKGAVQKHNAANQFCDVIRGWDALRVRLPSLHLWTIYIHKPVYRMHES